MISAECPDCAPQADLPAALPFVSKVPQKARGRCPRPPCLREGAMNGPMFLAYVKQCLVPTLKRDDTVIMDNLPVHKVTGVEQAIK